MNVQFSKLRNISATATLQLILSSFWLLTISIGWQRQNYSPRMWLRAFLYTLRRPPPSALVPSCLPPSCLPSASRLLTSHATCYRRPLYLTIDLAMSAVKGRMKDRILEHGDALPYIGFGALVPSCLPSCLHIRHSNFGLSPIVFEILTHLARIYLVFITQTLFEAP